MSASNSRRGGILFALSVVTLGIAGLIGVTAFLLFRNVHVYTRGFEPDRISIDTPAGSLDIARHSGFDASQAGVPVYPGAHPRNSGGSAVVEWTSRNGKEDKGFSVSEFVSPDPFDKVVEYYRGKLPDWSFEREHDGSVKFELDERDGKHFIGIERKDDGTHIGLASVGDPAAN